MKKLLLLVFLSSITVFAIAQTPVCQPDPQYTSNGVYPDSLTGLPPAFVNHLYSEIITVVAPSDTTGSYQGLSTTAQIDSIKITNWQDPASLNLPTNFEAKCEPPGCSFPGGSKGCILLTGIVTDIADTGDYQLSVETYAYGKITSPFIFAGQPIPAQLAQSTVDDYTISVYADSTGTGINSVDKDAFALLQNSPNPFAKKTNIRFINNKNGNVTFTVYNMVGTVIYSDRIMSINGSNTIIFNGSQLPSGIYSYSINNGEKVITKRMILLEN